MSTENYQAALFNLSRCDELLKELIQILMERISSLEKAMEHMCHAVSTITNTDGPSHLDLLSERLSRLEFNVEQFR